MSDRYIRGMLRRATQLRILHGWQGPHTDARSYTVSPAKGPAGEWPLDQVESYVHALEEAHVVPLFRSSEPVL